ncbi:MAG: FKBP-type peptidyl-prolyl cis-trans isomerase [Treponema sp.]|nr:FKBP-type peptidyl-prolyl cis-trans isomerase [Treponema sp.]
MAAIERDFPNAVNRPSGLRWIVVRAGTGARPAPGSNVQVNISGRLLSGDYFANSDLTGGPQEFPVGTGRIIPGLEEPLGDMRVGERRTVIVPPELAYGERGLEGAVPPNSFVVFELELVGIR